MDYQFLKVSCGENGVVTMTISSPATLNALNSTILGEIDTFIHTLDPNQVRVLVITGEGKSFVAGADISEMAHLSEKEGLAFGHRGSQVFKRIEDLPFPVIAAVNGFALGGGCELAMACDIRIASAKARFGQPEVGLGIIPGFSGTYRLPKLVGQGIAKELIYTGKMIGADEALRIGLVNQVVAPEELAGAVDALVNAILKNAPIAVGFAKACINENYDLDVDESIALENRYFAKCFATDDQKEGMDAFLHKRPAVFKNE
ncbi:MAG: enoyl-CoA hydratase/isomerase family protein [Bacteroidales bacterium]|jgi:enoyl-CoA hydratase|nr:enoyl-CoA hydratase/isomerase family protein [Bacteroidales bacterium]